jgi:hypothetical protein
MVNYQLGKIYKIIDNTTNKIYIGSTCEPTLARRLAKHTSNYKDFSNAGKTPYTTSFEIIKNGDCDIVLLEAFPCNSKDELHSRERFYIENNICINKNIPTRTEKEYKKIYLEKNKEQIKLKKSEKIICDICNRQYRKDGESRHRKSKFHLNCIEHDED